MSDPFVIFAFVAMVVLIVLVGWAIRRRRRRGQHFGPFDHSKVVATSCSDSARPGGPLDSVPPGTIDFGFLLRQFNVPWADDDPPALMLAQADGTALVMSDEITARSLGQIVGQAGPRLERAGRRGSSAIQAGITAGQRSGYLVQLHPDSAQAFKTLRADQVHDAAGYVRAALRGDDGKFAHVVKLKELGNLATLSSAGAVVSSLATQAQLDRIEKSIGELQKSVATVDDFIRTTQESRREALETSFGEIYSAARAVGALTPGQWSEISPRVVDTYELRTQTVHALEGHIRSLRDLPKDAKGRKAWLESLRIAIASRLIDLDRDDRLVNQAHALRLWHYSCSNDAALAPALVETTRLSQNRLVERTHILQGLRDNSGDVDVRRLTQRPRVRARRGIREQGSVIEQLARSHRLAIGQTTDDVEFEDPADWNRDDATTSDLAPEEIAELYSLTPEESVTLVVAQAWMMKQEISTHGSPSKIADTNRFWAEATETISRLTDIDADWIQTLASRCRDAHEKSSVSPIIEDSLLSQALRNHKRIRSLLLLIELSAFHPWSPTDPNDPVKTAQRWSKRSRVESLQHLASLSAEATPADAGRVLDAFRDAELLTGNTGARFAIILSLSVVGVGLGALTAGLAAPFIGGLIGTTVFGLTGAAATSAGLAALSGGALAAGGFGMAGGTVLLSTAGAALGAGIASGGGLGATKKLAHARRLTAQVTADVIKIHVLLRKIILAELHDVQQAGAVIEGLRVRRDEFLNELSMLPKRSTESGERAETRESLRSVCQLLTKIVQDLLLRRQAESRQRHN